MREASSIPRASPLGAWGASALLLLSSCRVDESRAPCTRDRECAAGEVCAPDGRCLSRDDAVLLPNPPGDDCTVVGGADQGCALEAICVYGSCASTSTLPAGRDGGTSADGGGSSGCGVATGTNTAPLFGGLSEAVADGPDAVLLRWFPAADETAPEAMRYRIYVATRAGAQDLTQPLDEVLGQTSARVTGLAENVTYFFLVRAFDAEGAQDCNVNERAVTLEPPPDCIEFSQHIQPILSAACVRCHAGTDPPQDLVLDSYQGVIAGGLTGSEVVACRPESSLLYRKIAEATPPVGRRMPYDGPPYLADAQIETFRRWIGEGARASCAEPSPCNDPLPPAFGGLASAALTRSATAAILAWAPAQDDTTAPGAIVYEVFESSASRAQDFTRPARLVTSAGALRAELPGLTPSTPYCWVVRARDAAGNRDSNTVERCLTTPAAACIDYGMVVQPIFDRHCIRCHSGAAPPQNLRLDSFAGVIAGGRTGSEVVACQPTSSLLYMKISSGAPPVGVRMPQDGPPYLAQSQIDAIAQWIGEGARSSCADPSPCSDQTPPTFAGLATAQLTRSATAARLCWSAGSDDSTPSSALHYDVFQSTTPGGEDFVRPPRATTDGVTCTEIGGLTPLSQYCWIVRARDLAGNRDANTVERCLSVPAAACIDYRSMVQPIFDTECVRCHSGAAPPQGLHLDTYAGALAGGSTGNEVVACQPASSLLFLKISQPNPPVGVRMPQDGPPYLSQAQMDTIEQWIREGARSACGAPDPCLDRTPPTFPGLTSATLDAAGGTARLCWSPATDDLTPQPEILYDVWDAAVPGGEDFSRPPRLTSTPGASCIDAAGLTPSTQYCWVARARDRAGNRDANGVERCVTTPAAACIDFASVVQPIFNANCVRCHSGSAPPRNLRLDSYAGTMAGGLTGNEVVSCQSSASLLYQKISQASPPIGVRMPQDGPPYLSPSQIAAIAQWIDEGARSGCSAPDPCSDAQPPSFAGLASARALDATRAELCWAQATDDVTPAGGIVYDAWEATTSGGQSFAGLPRLSSAAGATCVVADALSPAQRYCWVVRARDGAGNRDTNTVERCLDMPPLAAGCVDYVTMVQPLLDRHCTRCHSGASAPQWLQLDRYESVMAGSVRRNEVTACAPANSLLLQKVSATPPVGKRMPFDGPPYLSPAQIGLLSQWVAGGAPNNCGRPDVCTDTTVPSFGGVTSATPLDATTIRVCWGTATDAMTPASLMRYDLYESSAPGGEVFSQPAQHTVTGETCVLRTVAPATRMCFVVRARDLHDNRSNHTAELCATTPGATCALDYDQVQPIFSARCVHCHRGDLAPRDLRLTGYAGVLAGGALRSEVIACDPAGSVLIQKLGGAICGRRMPFDGPPYLAPSERSVLEGWIRSGARRSCNLASPCADATPPVFAGISAAVAIDAGTVELRWSPATDNNAGIESISYDVYEARTPTSFSFTEVASHTAPAGSASIRFSVPPAQQLCYIVRARDLRGTHESNTVSRCVTPPAACVDYDALVNPIFQTRCVQCHSGSSAPRGIRWDTYAHAIANTDEVSACDPGGSKLVEEILRCRMARDTSSDMCHTLACLPRSSQSIFSSWVAEGAQETCTAGICP
ncbi:MAG: hypothetical protein IT384_07735 [Deltaproteobacteria bacterium]|nr:hypothetical protein [Deltaproteobacteria bacterium]